MKNKRKFLFLGVILIVIIILVIFFMMSKENDDKIVFDESIYVQIYLYNLGKSNIEIIIKDEFVIMINTGLEEERDNLIEYLERHGIEEIDYLILTNRDDKYIGNAEFIVNNLKVDYLYINDYEYTSSKVDSLFNVLNDSYTEKIVLSSNEIITLDSLVINIYPYLEDEFEMEDKTFVVNITENNNTLYFTYNASNKRIREIGKANLLVSEEKDILSKDANYYIYDGKDSVKGKNILERPVIIYMNEKELIVK